MEYVFIFILLCVLVYKYDYLRTVKHKWLWYYIILILLTCLAGFRYKIGIDSIRYETYFNTSQNTLTNLDLFSFSILRYEPLYELFCAFCKSIIDEFWFLQIMQAALVNFVIFYFFRRYTANVFVAVTLYTLLYFLGFTMETMRAGCAVAMMLLGYDQFKRGNNILSIIFFIASFLFHYESVILIPLFFYLKIADNKIRMGKWFWITILLLLVLSPLVVFLFRHYIGIFAITDRMSDNIDIYGSGGSFDTKLSVLGMISSFIFVVSVPLFCIYSIKKSRRYYAHEAIALWSIIIMVISLDIVVFYRYREYFGPFIILLLADSFNLDKIYLSPRHYINLQSYAVKCLIVIFPILLTTVSSQTRIDPEANVPCYWEYYPYTSIFNPRDYNERDALYNAHIYAY